MVKVLSKNENSGIRVFRFLKKLKKIPFASYRKGCVFGNFKSSEENLYVDFQLVALSLTFTFRSSDDSDLVEEVESG